LYSTTELVRNRQQQCVSGRDRLVIAKILDQLVRFPRVCFAESRDASVDLALG